MNAKMQEALLHCETDIQGAMQRFCGNEDIYLSYLRDFPEEPTMKELSDAVDARAWEKAFMAAHALKGLSGNLGFIPLYHAIAEMVILLRSGKYGDVKVGLEHAQKCYDELVTAIKTK